MDGNDERSIPVEEWVDRHLAGDLSPDEQREFEQLLATSESAQEALARAVQAELDLATVIGSGVPEALFDGAVSFESVSFDRPPYESTGVSSSRGWLWQVGVAAGLLFAVVAFIAWSGDPSPGGGSGDSAGPILAEPKRPSVQEMLATPGLYEVGAGTRFAFGSTTVQILERSNIDTGLARVDRESPSTLPIVLVDGAARITGQPLGLRLQTAAGRMASASDTPSSYEIRISRLPEGASKPSATALRTPVLSTLLVLSGLVAYHSFGTEPVLVDVDAGHVTLSNDGSIGVVRDREGLAHFRHLNQPRWSLAGKETRLLPGDWVKTATRGASAIVLVLANETRLTLGPATQIELSGIDTVKLIRGDLHVATARGAKCTVEGPRGGSQTIAATATVALREGALARLGAEPRWLVGYQSDRTTDALGSLLANVDGRDVPLTMGYHKVTVDIRDQIARTVIEESFINHTSTILEGVFYFPLPADASISGFAMWIGGEKVHGEIVEKQRAREIYETILRERRDPGLLEWAGGSIFKARVFPISREKRIEIAYTQVLPKVDRPLAEAASVQSTYRYRYGLASELTRLTPLEKLEIHVRIASEDSVLSVTSPSHPCRIETDTHAARVEYSAEDVVPDRDFELTVTTEPKAGGPLRAITHRRGDDGYFMMLLDALPLEGEVPAVRPARDLIVVADTSGSISEATRRAQLVALETLLAGLGDEDRFAFLTVDSEVRWLGQLGERFHGDADSVERALAFFDRRNPFGGTRLVDALREALSRARAQTHIVYLGDGVDTHEYFEPTALIDAVRRVHRAGRIHAVAVGPHEARVLKGFAQLSGGSVRAVSGPEDAIETMHGLLEELSRPTIEGLELDIRGVDVAAIYPKTVPNLPLGSQAVLVGRFDATQRSAGATIRVRGRLGDAAWETEFPLDLRTEDGGNSFIPRLWARRHLDHLLSQGPGAETTATIIRLSEDFQIATPYTSFLVLESDADRERFGVRKRMRIRDGEDFFAKGRENVEFALVRKAMLAAKTWRLDLRNRALEVFTDLGRTAAAPSGWGRPGPRLAGVGGARLFRGERRDGGFSEQRVSASSGETLAEDYGFESAREFEQLASSARRSSVFKKSLAGPATLLRKRESIAATLSDLGRYGRRKSVRDRRLWPATGSLLVHFPRMPGTHPARERAAWPADVLERMNALDRRGVLRSASLSIRHSSVFIDASGSASAPTIGEWLLSASAWFQATPHRAGDAHNVRWFDGEQRGIARADWLLARVRPKRAGDEQAWGVLLGSLFDHLAAHYVHYDFVSQTDVTVPNGDLTWRVQLQLRRDPEMKVEFDIDLTMNVVRAWRTISNGEVTASTTAEDFHEVAGHWWPRQLSVRGPAGQITQRHRYEIAALTEQAFARQLTERLSFRDRAVLLGPLRSDRLAALQAVRDAASNDATPSLEDQFQIADSYLSRQLFDRAEPYVTALLDRIGARIGRSRLELAALSLRRRNEEFRALAMKTAARVVREGGPADRAAVDDLFNSANETGWSERLELLTPIEVVYRRLGRPEIMADHRYRRYQCLWGTGDLAGARDVLRALCLEFPDRVQWSREYAMTLSTLGEVAAALEWLDELERTRGPRQEQQAQTLRSTRFDILHGNGRTSAAVQFFAEWLARAQRGEASAPDRYRLELYLADLMRLDRVDEFEQRWRAWLDTPLDILTTLDRNKVTAALNHGLGRGPGVWTGQTRPLWRGRLLAFAIRAFESGELGYFSTVFGDRNFARTDEGRALQATVADRVEAELEMLTFAQVQSALTGLGPLELAARGGMPWRQRLIARYVACWIATEEPDENGLVWSLTGSYGAVADQLSYWHHRVSITANAPQRRQSRMRLLETLLNAFGTVDLLAELDRECIALMTTLATEEPAEGTDSSVEREARISSAISAIRHFVNAYSSSFAAAEIQADPGSNEWTRRALQLKRGEFERDGLRRVREALGRVTAVEPAVARFLTLERVWVGAKSGARPAEVVEELKACLGELLEVEIAEGAKEQRRSSQLERCIASLGHYAVFGPDELADELRADVLQLLVRERDREGERFDATGWLITFYTAFDRVAPLVELLAESYGDGTRTEQLAWGRRFAFVRAELGEIAEAISTLESVGGVDILGRSDLMSIATWYQALGDQARWREARVRSFAVSDEWTIAQWIQRQRNSLAGDVPGELDPDVEFAFVALFQKSRRPGEHVHQLLDLYRRTRDFRLLRALGGSVIGHSAQGIYPMLEALRHVVGDLQEEATLDQCVSEIEKHRAGDLTEVDRRGLDLFEFFVRQRALELGHGIEEHERGVLAALERADQIEFAPGEPLAKGTLLGVLGEIHSTAVLREVLEQLAHCQDGAPRGSASRTRIAFWRAGVMWRNAGSEDADRDRAVRIAESAIEEVRTSHDARVPSEVQDLLPVLGTYYQERGRFRDGERMWRQELASDYSRSRHWWTTDQWVRYLVSTYERKGGIALGSGFRLFDAVESEIDRALEVQSTDQRAAELVQRRVRLWRSARIDPRILRERVLDFAFRKLPDVLQRYQYRRGQEMVETVAEVVRALVNTTEAIRFLVARAENEPRWLLLQSLDFWIQHGDPLTRYVHEVEKRGELPEALDARVLRIVLAELRRDLRQRHSRRQSIYHDDHTYFWREKRDEFARVAREVAVARTDSGPTTAYVATYLYHGLGLREEAVTILMAALRRGVLGFDSRLMLVRFLRQADRLQDALPIARASVDERPQHLEAIGALVRCYADLDRAEDARQALAAAEAGLRADGALQEVAVAALARHAASARLAQESLRLYDEAIHLRTRSRVNRGVGDGTLARYYETQSKMYSQLGRTKEAVDTAAGAIVAWGRNQTLRTRMLRQLEKVLSGAKDLDAFVGTFEAEVAQTKLENPMLRRALGAAYVARGDAQSAIRHFEIAVALSPENLDGHRSLIAAWDQLGDEDRSIAATIRLATVARRDLDLYRQLGDRLAELERPADAERAYTAMVEATPNESEGHAALADVRERQHDHRAAVRHWREVTRIRSNEPDGYYRLAKGLIEIGEKAETRDVIDRLRTTEWPEHFGSQEGRVLELESLLR